MITKKKPMLLTFLMTVLMACAMMLITAGTAYADVFVSDEGFRCGIDTDGTAYIYGWGSVEEIPEALTIPAAINFNGATYSVKSIVGTSFSGNQRIKKLTVENGISMIGGETFKDCSGLSEIHLPDSIREVDKDTFSGTAYYTNDANWADGVLYIDNCLIAANSSISSNYEIREGTTVAIAGHAFTGRVNLRSISIPASVVTIGASAFYGCGILKTVAFAANSNLTKIGGHAFRDCSSLESIVLPEGLAYIDDCAFINCRELKEITIPSTVTEIKDEAFANCDRLTTIHFGGSETQWAKITGDGKPELSPADYGYTVKFVDGFGRTLATETVTGRCAATPPDDPLKEGYNFKGWDPADFSCIIANTTVTAQWEKQVFVVNFRDDPGTAPIMSQMVEYGDAATPPDDPLKEGYNFKGWDKDFSRITANTTVTALWAKTYTVTFKDELNNTSTSETVEYGDRATAPANPTRTGYNFKGWDKDFSRITADTTVTAKWEKKTFTVTFKDELNNTSTSETVEYGEAATAPANPTRTGYNFKGWDKDFSSITADTTVTAKWEKKTYTVTFVDGQNNTIKSETVKYKEAATAPANPTRTGYTFKGWDKDFSSITASITVTAKWEKNADPQPATYTVTFVDGQGNTLKTQTVEKGKPATAPANPARTGYTFKGWDKDFSSITASITVTAKWEKNADPQPPAPTPVSIKDAEVVLSSASYTYNGKVRKPSVTTIGGMTLQEGTDYTVSWSNASSKNAGSYTVTITGKGKYTGTTQAAYKIKKAANPLKIKARAYTVSYDKLKAKNQKLSVKKVIKFKKNGKGALTYKRVKGSKKITIDKKTGRVTIKRGLKKGSYKVKVSVKAKGTANYKASAKKYVTFTIKVK